MLQNLERPQNFLRYGMPKTKELLRDVSPLYDGLVIPANILLYQHKATPALIFELKKPFFIDPMSYLFSHPFEKFKIQAKYKPSFVKLLQGYGIPESFLKETKSSSLIRHLKSSPGDFKKFVQNCIEMQAKQVSGILKKAQEDGLIPENLTTDLKPEFIIPPYFKISDSQDLEFMKLILVLTSEKRNAWTSITMFPLIFISKDVLINRDLVDAIITVFAENGWEGYCIWIDDADERNMNRDEIAGLVYLCETLSKNKEKAIVILYGGFFNMSLYNYGVTAVSHGLAVSEFRKIDASVSQQDGPAPIRYYLPKLHQFLTIENALKILRERRDLICDCVICKKIIGNDPDRIALFQSKDERQKYENLAIIHFLNKRHQEKTLVASLTNEGLVEYLANVISTFSHLASVKKTSTKSIDPNPIINFPNLKAWKTALQKTSDNSSEEMS